MSDALIGYYIVLRKNRKWYRSLMYHFVDVAVVNAFIIHQQLTAIKKKKAKSQREFQKALVSQLADWMLPPAESAEYATWRHQSSALPVMLLCFLPQHECFNNWHYEL